MIDLNIQDYDLPVYAYDFRQRALLVFDGVEVTGESLKQPFRKIWASQPISSFLSAIKPAIFWSPSPVEAVSPYVFARKESVIYRFSRIEYTLAHKAGLKGNFSTAKFTDPEDLVKLSTIWFTTAFEAWQAY
jgi:hypothetical protein